MAINYTGSMDSISSLLVRGLKSVIGTYSDPLILDSVTRGAIDAKCIQLHSRIRIERKQYSVIVVLILRYTAVKVSFYTT